MLVGTKATIKEDIEIKAKLDFSKESESAHQVRETSQAERNRQYWLGREIYNLVEKNLNLTKVEQLRFLGRNANRYTKWCVAEGQREVRRYAEKVRASRWYNKNRDACERRIAGKKIEADKRIEVTYRKIIAKKVFGLVMMTVGSEKDAKLRNKILWKLRIAEVDIDNDRELKALSFIKFVSMNLMQFS